MTPRDEEFRPIAGYARYSVSNYGRVFSEIRAKRHLKPWISRPSGYLFVSLMTNDGRVTRQTVHRLVAEAFIPNPGQLPTINHKNGVKTDNIAVNLEWMSYGDNNGHARKTGLNQAFGETHYGAKLTWEIVNEIRKLVQQGMLHREVAAIFNISRKNVTKIVGFKSWRRQP